MPVALLTGASRGLGSALALSRFVSSQLFGVKPADPAILAAATALLASKHSARRPRVNPHGEIIGMRRAAQQSVAKSAEMALR